MSKKWKCIKECYVPVGGVLRKWLPGAIATGEIDKSAEKLFVPVKTAPAITAPDPEAEAKRAAVKAELDALVDPKVSYHPNTGLEKLEALLKAEKEKRAEA
jgi:hypothetical protein